ncbi:MAG: hypothetical protein BEN19_02830 [Epulopiscium sp. Nuni2H_MBin003]|nr:MAG: hypothetical protein BEN19_02830 [Epulopiscium sp. Nuni2H_MBin003]
MLSFKGYSFKEKIHYVKGNIFSNKCLWDKLCTVDLSELVTEVNIPVYIFQGRFDYICSYKLAKEFFNHLKAPTKAFYTFNNSANSPCYEEPDKMCDILVKDVLQNKTYLSD